ncbi:hypothetical protein CRUP_030960 [Coryphaenoides rupestris]|nr:hypothetical protein CRUP_030960 [Coryphaenoides rupestris]
MATRGPLLLLSVAFFCLSGGAAEPSALSQSDVSFCHGGLEVLYPEMNISKCLTIPKVFREKISKTKSYALVMVDPDAPSRSNPSRAHWRHWLLVDVKGGKLRSRDLDANILSGNWDPLAFSRRFNLGEPVAVLQFLTQNYRD